GLPGDGADAHPRLARLAAATEDRRRHRHAVRPQRVGRGLPADAAGLRLASERAARLVASYPAADRDEGHTSRSRNWAAHGSRVEANERAFLHLHVLAVDTPRTRAPDDDGHLLLPRVHLVVLVALGIRRQVEPVDPERPNAELSADEPNDAVAAGRLDLVDPNDAVTHWSCASSRMRARGAR